jgi:hypothetical protein
MKVAYEDKIKPEVDRQWTEAVANGTHTGAHTAAFRANVALTMFTQLPRGEQDGLKKQAVEEKIAAVKAYEEELKKPISKLPADRQK